METTIYILFEYDGAEKALRAYTTRKDANSAKKQLEEKRKSQTKTGSNFPEFYEPRYFYRVASCKLIKGYSDGTR